MSNLINSYRFAKGFDQQGKYTEAELDNMITNLSYIPVVSSDEFNNIRTNISEIMGLGSQWEGTYTTGTDKKYVQINDIDLVGYSNFTAFTNFTGLYDGNEVVIDNLSMNLLTTNLALFGLNTVGAGSILNIRTTNSIITGASQSMGILAGACLSTGSIINCRVEGSITQTGTGGRVGGICGNNLGFIENCEADVILTTSADYAGAIVGYGQSTGVVNKCVAKGIINSTANYVGGIIGYSPNTVDDCSAKNEINGNSIVGGCIGRNAAAGIATNCYSIGLVNGNANEGGFCGYNDNTIVSCYYDTTTSGQSDTGKGEPKTTTEMQQGSIPDTTIYVGWSALIWDAVDNVSYPILL